MTKINTYIYISWIHGTYQYLYTPASSKFSVSHNEYHLAAQLRSTNITDQHANYGTATAPCISHVQYILV